MAGGYPACVDDEENDELLLLLMRDYGFDTFVCLQSEVSSHVTERAWRSGRARDPTCTTSAASWPRTGATSPTRRWISSTFPSSTAPSRPTRSSTASSTTSSVGSAPASASTSTVGAVTAAPAPSSPSCSVACTTSPHPQALERTQLLHDLRDEPQDVGSPSTEVQVAQVRRLLSARYGGPGDGDPGRGNLHRGDRAGYGGGYGGYGEYGGYGGYAGRRVPLAKPRGEGTTRAVEPRPRPRLRNREDRGRPPPSRRDRCGDDA